MRISLKVSLARAREAVKSGHSIFLQSVGSHPVLLIPLSVAYGFLTLVVGVISLLLGVAVSLLWSGPQVQYAVGGAFFGVFFAAFAPIVWAHYLYVAFRGFASAASLRGYSTSLLRVVQLVAVTAFIFAAAHYYVALFSDGLAYEGLHKPVPEYGWTRWQGPIDKLLFVPPIDTVVDCIYFSTVTMATVGYGDIHPVSMLAKVVCSIQIVFSFGLVVVVLAWVIGHPNEGTKHA